MVQFADQFSFTLFVYDRFSYWIFLPQSLTYNLNLAHPITKWLHGLFLAALETYQKLIFLNYTIHIFSQKIFIRDFYAHCCLSSSWTILYLWQIYTYFCKIPFILSLKKWLIALFCLYLVLITKLKLLTSPFKNMYIS